MKVFNKARKTLPICYYAMDINKNTWHYRLYNIFRESRKGYNTFYCSINGQIHGKVRSKNSIRKVSNMYLASQIHSEKIYNHQKYKGVSYGRKRYKIGRFNISNNYYYYK